MHHLLLQVDMTLWVLQQLKDKGILFILMGLAIWYFARRQTATETKLDEVQKRHEDYITNDRQTLLTAFNNNTEIIKEFKDEMRDLRSVIQNVNGKP